MQLKTGAIINISWPDTKVRNASSWYDYPATWVDYCKDGYYKVGHAALLLIDYRTGDVNYFDFGRYHTPDGYGRVRDAESDPEMEMTTKAIIGDKGIVVNITDILFELDENKSSHGVGKLVASVNENIDFDRAITTAKMIQDNGATPYGPFQFFGTNCSRYVATVYKAGVCTFWRRFKINLSYIYSHTPTSNITTTHTYRNVYVVENGQWAHEDDMWKVFNNTISVPTVNARSVLGNRETKIIPDDAFYLKGQGGNTYFTLEKTNKSHLFLVKRYSEYGELEIDTNYQIRTIGFDFNKPFEFTYISNGITVKLKQGDQVFELMNVKFIKPQIKKIQYSKWKTWRFKSH